MHCKYTLGTPKSSLKRTDVGYLWNQKGWMSAHCVEFYGEIQSNNIVMFHFMIMIFDPVMVQVKS